MRAVSSMVLAALVAAVSPAASAQSPYRQWLDVTPPAPRAGMVLTTMAVHPLDARRLIAGFRSGTDAGALMESSDGGVSWRRLAGEPTGLRTVGTLFAHPGRPGVVYLHETAWALPITMANVTLHNVGRTFVSADFGVSWRLAYAGDNAPVAAFTSDPLEPDRVIGTLQSESMCCRFPRQPVDFDVVSSRDGGSTWVASGAFPANVAAYRFTANGPTRSAPARIFFTRGVAHVSLDSGATFRSFVSTWRSSLLSIAQDPHRENRLYAISEGPDRYPDFLLRSDDLGATWRAMLPFIARQDLPAITLDPARRDEIWLWNMVDAVYHSTDGGEHWGTVGTHSGFFAADPPALVPSQDGGLAQLVLSPAEPAGAFVIWKGRLYHGVREQELDPVLVEFQYEGDRYWVAATQGEALSQDYRMEPGHVRRTGLRWGGWRADDAPAGAVGSCRFWPTPEVGRTRVLVQQGFECDALKRDPRWILEAEGEFFTLPATNGACAAGSVAVHRFHNLKADFNHRWVADDAIAAEMRARGWYDEGVRFCARPLGANE